jgi:arabinose-5-phosphate isomerase
MPKDRVANDRAAAYPVPTSFASKNMAKTGSSVPPATSVNHDEKMRELGRAVVEIEAREVAALAGRIDDRFVSACNLMLRCAGRTVVLGMGKSGHIGGKIAATLASTGSPAFFVHPGEASHGDLGMITAQDVVLALSNSGETEEILTILPIIKRLGVPLIALTGNLKSTLAKNATVAIDVSVREEACPLGLAPTSSTTATLAMGDALAIALLETRGFTKDEFARAHPAGRLGRRLLLHISDVMHTGDEIPRVAADATLAIALVEMTRKGMGMTAVTDAAGKALGIFTDGDLRRVLDRGAIDIHNTRIADVMKANPHTAGAQLLAAEALQLMQSRRINQLLIADERGVLVGALNMHDLLRAGVV